MNHPTVFAAVQKVSEFLANSGLTWSAFENSFDTLQHIVVNEREVNLGNKAPLIRIVKEIRELYTQNMKRLPPKHTWHKFYTNVFAAINRINGQLPDGLEWKRVGKNEWAVARVAQRATAMLGKILDRTIPMGGVYNTYTFKQQHPLLQPRHVLNNDGRQQRRLGLQGKLQQHTNHGFVIDLNCRIPIKHRSQVASYINNDYFNRSAVIGTITQLINGNTELTSSLSKTAELYQDQLCFTEKLDIILHA